MYCCNITSNVHKTDTITFLHPCERLVVQKVVNLQGIRTLFIYNSPYAIATFLVGRIFSDNV
jgi:hypothetical protein